MAYVKQGIFTGSKGRQNVTAVNVMGERVWGSESLIGPHGENLPNVTGAIIGQEFWRVPANIYYKFDGTAWIPIGGAGAGAGNSQWTAFMVASDSPGSGVSGGEYFAQYNTIQSAINAAAAVATAAHPRLVLIAPETFNENINLLPNVHLRGDSANNVRPTINGEVTVAGSIGSIEVNGIDFQNDDGVNGVITFAPTAGSMLIRNCSITGVDGAPAPLTMLAVAAAPLTVIDTKISSPAGTSIEAITGSGAVPTFDRCQIEDAITYAEATMGFDATRCRFNDITGSVFAGAYRVSYSYYTPSIASSSIGVTGATELSHCYGALDILLGNAQNVINDCDFDMAITGNTGTTRISRSRITTLSFSGSSATVPTYSFSESNVSGPITQVRGRLNVVQSTIDSVDVSGVDPFVRIAQSTFRQAVATSVFGSLGDTADVMVENTTFLGGGTRLVNIAIDAGNNTPCSVQFIGCVFEDQQIVSDVDSVGGTIRFYNNYHHYTGADNSGVVFVYDNGTSTSVKLYHTENIIDLPVNTQWANVTGVTYNGTNFYRGHNTIINGGIAILGTPFTGPSNGTVLTTY